MLDSTLRPLIDPPLNALARPLAAAGLPATALTIANFGVALVCMACVWQGYFWTAFSLVAVNRLIDGLDGPLARQTHPDGDRKATGESDLGGYLDIVIDFFFYSGLVFAFALHDPPTNALAAAFLIFSYIATGTTFLTYAIIAEKRKVVTAAQGKKSFFYLGGLAEGTETALVMLAMCALPFHFTLIAWIFGGVCWISALGRVIQAVHNFSDNG